MGKKSRRKKDEKSSRKERLQERRERVQDVVNVQEEGGSEEEYFTGDRVFYYEESNPEEDIRAIFKGFTSEGKLKVLPMEKEDTIENEVVVGQKYVFRDPFDHWTLRFDVGTRVLCRCGGFLQPAIIHDQFPYIDGGMCAYRCQRIDNGGFLAVPEDSDAALVKHPVSFRFRKGDQVVFSTLNARGLNQAGLASWVVGRIVREDIIHRGDYYFFECSFEEKGQSMTCYIVKDDDEHIASVTATARERLMDSIDCDCSYHHIDQLVKSGSIDVASFQDLIIKKAIEKASYNMLLWLQEVDILSLSSYCGPDGCGIMHHIARSPNADRFLRRAAIAEKQRPRPQRYIELKFGERGKLALLIEKHPETGCWWFHELLSSNVRALDVLFSRDEGLAWMFLPGTHSTGPLLAALQDLRRATAGSSRRNRLFSIPAMIDEFSRCVCLRDMANRLDLASDINAKDHDVPSELDIENFHGESQHNITKRLIRFVRQYEDGHSSFEFSMVDIIHDLVRNNDLVTLRRFVEVDDSLLNIQTVQRLLPRNADEFTQPERLHFPLSSEDLAQRESLSLVAQASHGREWLGEITANDAKLYFSIILKAYVGLRSPQDHHIAYFIERQLKHYSDHYSFSRMLEYKLSLLKEDVLLRSRLEILDYLVKDRCLPPPSAVDVVRWRQCGVLCWLIESGIVDLFEIAAQQEQYARAARHLEIFRNNGIPADMLVGTFLALIAVEFDDLQTVEMLTAAFGVPMDDIRIDGWNIVHISAYFGRAEIVISFESRSPWPALMSEKSDRMSFKSCYATHIAVERGFTFVADRLLESGCPSVDARGRGLDFYARKSGFDFVIEWAKEKGQTSHLVDDISRLHQLLRQVPICLDDVKEHILNTDCLNYETWVSCGICEHDTPGPSNQSYLGVLKACVATGNDCFITWLCWHLTPTPDSVWESAFDIQLLFFWGENPFSSRKGGENELSLASLLEFAQSTHDERLTCWLNMPCCRHISCLEPCHINPLIGWVLADSMDSHVTEAAQIARSRIIRTLVLREIFLKFDQQARRLLASGAAVQHVDVILNELMACAKALAEETEKELSSILGKSAILKPDGSVNLECFLASYEGKTHPLSWRQMSWPQMQGADRESTFVVLAAEGYDELIRLCFTRKYTGNSRIEFLVARIAGYLGHEQVVGMLTLPRSCGKLSFSSSHEDRYRAAVLGAAESGKLGELSWFTPWTSTVQSDPILSYIKEGTFVEKISEEDKSNVLDWSVLCALARGYIDSHTEAHFENPYFALISAAISGSGGSVSADLFLRVVAIAKMDSYQEDLVPFEKILDLLEYLVESYKVYTGRCESALQRLSQMFVKTIESNGSRIDNDIIQAASRRWFQTMLDIGVDIQMIYIRRWYSLPTKGLDDILSEIKSSQRQMWSQFDVIKDDGVSLKKIQDAVDSGLLSLDMRDRGGLQLIHLAAAYNRDDVLEWLVEDRRVSIDAIDGQGQTVLEIARASKATKTTQWIEQRQSKALIASFISKNYKCALATRRMLRLLRGIVRLQALCRGFHARKAHKAAFLCRLESSQRFQDIWRRSLLLLDNERIQSAHSTWGAIKQEKHDMLQARELWGDEEVWEETNQTLDAALERALADPTQPIVGDAGKTPDGEAHPDITSDLAVEMPGHLEEGSTGRTHDIMFTKYVDNWLRVFARRNPRYREIFVNRMRQLGAGERSKILSKRLTGCTSTIIYETYMDSNFRILWTEQEDGTLLIWYVSKHDRVPRYMRLVDDAERRRTRQFLAASTVLELQGAQPEEIHLDPFSDTPLKMYAIRYNEVDDIATKDWSPRLHLTREEREIVENKGTTLVLGRSGTGKTLCICNRMEYDALQQSCRVGFSQLFVSRSGRLRTYVEETVGRADTRTFTTFDELKQSLERSLVTSSGEIDTSFVPSRRMTFARYKRDVYRPDLFGSIDELVIWKNIQSFIKGSIEALQGANNCLSEDDYMDRKVMGSKRCRLIPEQRKVVYKAFERYAKYMKEKQLWDDCDRVAALLKRLQETQQSDWGIFEELKYSKIYVDEVQDYTQAEILLFFYLSGAGDLFLAGDPAQSVVEDVEFRFEDIRSVGYHCSGAERRDLIPDKPKILTVNFRSHSGILNTAAAVLTCLFRVFPDSAKQLKEDRGLFLGPRPGVFMHVQVPRLKELISKVEGVVVLTHDASVARWKHILEYELIYGIREAKGLEFKAVIMLDFFNGLPSNLKKPWRDLMLARDGDNSNAAYPELESYIKLLYTGVTRCIQRLFFVETAASVSGDAFVRWVTTTTVYRTNDSREALAVRSSVDSVERMTRTPDEWRSAGVDNAIMAESADDGAEAESWLDKALFCFQQVADVELARKARAHRASARLRSKLSSYAFGEACDDLEMEASHVAEGLLSENLLLETRQLLHAVLPYLSEYSNEQLQQRLLSRLPESI